MEITKDILYVGVNDHDVDLFEGHYIVPDGMAYNSYVIKGDKIAVMDSVDEHFADKWISKVKEAAGSPDYFVVQHMEPDHSGSIMEFMKAFPEAQIVSSQKAFAMMANFFEGEDFADRRVIVKEGDTLNLGGHTLAFVTAPMVHWPEVIMTYDVEDKVLFAADGFGRFGALDVIGETNEEDDDWACEARRYYVGIVGKYGPQVQAVLKKAAKLDIEKICSLHGPVLIKDLGYHIGLYDTWSKYEPESQGVVIAYTSVYGHTKKAVELLAEKLEAMGVPEVVVTDLARSDIAEAVEDAFRYDTVVFAPQKPVAELETASEAISTALGYMTWNVPLVMRAESYLPGMPTPSQFALSNQSMPSPSPVQTRGRARAGSPRRRCSTSSRRR